MRTPLQLIFPLALAFSAPALLGQSEVSISNPKPPAFVGRFLRPFHLEKRQVAPAKLANTARLESLVRSGNLYLSVQDVIALVLENNLDLAVQRYTPFLNREVIRRAEGGGILRSIDTPIVAGPSSVSTAGISSNATGLAGGALNSGAGGDHLDRAQSSHARPEHLHSGAGWAQHHAANQHGAGGDHGVDQQLPQFCRRTTANRSSPGPTWRSRSTTRGTYVNSSSLLFNPTLTGFFDFTINQPLLQGFSLAVNSRIIKVARNSQKLSDMQMRLQVATTISAALNLYWDLVSFNEAVRIKERAVAVAQALYEGNKKQVAIGALSGIEVTRAAAAVSVSEGGSADRADQRGAAGDRPEEHAQPEQHDNAWLDDVHIIPLDSIEVPKTEEIRPIQDLVQEALANRTEIARDRINMAEPGTGC